MSQWMICPDCEGNGKHSKHIGAITEEDRDRDWSYDEFDDYMAGAYDKACDMCKGSGKVRTQGHVCPACSNDDQESIEEDYYGTLTCRALIDGDYPCHEMWHPQDPCKAARDREWREPPSYRYEY